MKETPIHSYIMDRYNSIADFEKEYMDLAKELAIYHNYELFNTIKANGFEEAHLGNYYRLKTLAKTYRREEERGMLDAFYKSDGYSREYVELIKKIADMIDDIDMEAEDLTECIVLMIYQGSACSIDVELKGNAASVLYGLLPNITGGNGWFTER